MRYLIVVGFLLLFSCQGRSQSIVGTWTGDLTIQGAKLPLIFQFLESDGVWSGVLVSPQQSQTEVPFSMVRVHDDSLHVEISMMGIRFSGQVSADRKSINGVFRQGALSTELILSPYSKEVGSAALGATKKSKRLQDPMPPYPYDTVDVAFANTIDQVTLRGTITRPRESGKYPAVILVSGSGQQNRDSELMGHKPFKVLADFLTRQGIIVLRYDDRGTAQSEGDFASSTIGNFSKDAMAALDFLKKQEDVDTDRLGMIGHSEGALISLILAGQGVPDLKYAVALGAPSISIDSLMVLQTYYVGKSQGMSEQQLERVRPINRKNFQIVKSDLDAQQARALLLENMRPLIGNMEHSEELSQEIAIMLMDQYRYFMRIEPVPFIQKIKVPIFAAFGGKDVQVPAIENMESLADHLPKDERHFINLYPDLNHLFQPAKTGAVSEYSTISTTMDPVLMNDVVRWIKER